MAAPFSTQYLDIDPKNWTPIVAPFGCNNVGIRNTLGVEINICTDLSLPDYDVIASQGQEGIAARFRCEVLEDTTQVSTGRLR
jgi:hypothetical protein